jgi:hypothetical protein
MKDFEEKFVDALGAFGGVGYTVAFLFLMIWIRLLLIVIDEAIGPRSGKEHKFVHPLRAADSKTEKIEFSGKVPGNDAAKDGHAADEFRRGMTPVGYG